MYDAATHLFTGKERDTESGNDYFGARYYASSMGRFMSPDPSQLYFADPMNPQSLNLYSYALNNPLSNTDPTGMYCYYGDTSGGAQSDADNRDASQFDYHSSQSECTAKDENGNQGEWINDAETHQDASGDMIDNDGRQESYAISMDANGSTSPQPSATGAVGDLVSSSAGGWIDNLFSSFMIGPHDLAQFNTTPYRLFGTRYCGPGGAGATTGILDVACKAHDAAYSAAKISFTNNLPGGSMSPSQAAAAQSANQALYDTARKNNGAPGSQAAQYWVTKGANLPFGYIIQPGTEAKAW